MLHTTVPLPWPPKYLLCVGFRGHLLPRVVGSSTARASPLPGERQEHQTCPLLGPLLGQLFSLPLWGSGMLPEPLGSSGVAGTRDSVVGTRDSAVLHATDKAYLPSAGVPADLQGSGLLPFFSPGCSSWGFDLHRFSGLVLGRARDDALQTCKAEQLAALGGGAAGFWGGEPLVPGVRSRSWGLAEHGEPSLSPARVSFSPWPAGQSGSA